MKHIVIYILIFFAFALTCIYSDAKKEVKRVEKVKNISSAEYNFSIIDLYQVKFDDWRKL